MLKGFCTAAMELLLLFTFLLRWTVDFYVTFVMQICEKIQARQIFYKKCQQLQVDCGDKCTKRLILNQVKVFWILNSYVRFSMFGSYSEVEWPMNVQSDVEWITTDEIWKQQNCIKSMAIDSQICWSWFMMFRKTENKLRKIEPKEFVFESK